MEEDDEESASSTSSDVKKKVATGAAMEGAYGEAESPSSSRKSSQCLFTGRSV